MKIVLKKIIHQMKLMKKIGYLKSFQGINPWREK